MTHMDLLDTPPAFDPINRIEGVISTFINADWDGAYQRRGVYGLISEFLDCLIAQNAPTLFVSRYSLWSGLEIERLLRRHGVKVWNRGFMGDELYFCVKLRQVKWAEYLLLRAGIPLVSQLVEPRNREYTQGYAPGSEPPTRSKPRKSFWF